jgi:hypothetical protein
LEFFFFGFKNIVFIMATPIDIVKSVIEAREILVNLFIIDFKKTAFPMSPPLPQQFNSLKSLLRSIIKLSFPSKSSVIIHKHILEYLFLFNSARMSKLGEDGEHINVKEFSLELLEEQNIEEEPRTMFLSAGVAFILFGAILWTVLGTQSVDKIVEAYKFQKSSCQVVPSEALVKNLSCQCEGRSVCQSMYPCVRINVVLKNQKTSLNGSVVRTILYNSIYEVHSEVTNT